MPKRSPVVSEEDAKRFAGYDALRTLREEIALTRLAIEQTIREADASGHWNAYAVSISGLMDTLVQLIQANTKIDPLLRLGGKTCHSNEQL